MLMTLAQRLQALDGGELEGGFGGGSGHECGTW